MTRPLVVITDHLAEAGVERTILDPVADVLLLQTNDEAEVIARATAARVLLVFHDIRLTERALAALTQCIGIVRCGVGYDNVDIQAAGARGIVVCNVPDYGTEEVADHALGMMLAVTRRMFSCDASVRTGRWDVASVFGTPRLRARTLGILGCGRIGTAMAQRAKPLGLDIVLYDPYQPPGLEKALGVRREYECNAFLGQCEILSLHCPLTTETHHIVNAEALARMPRGAYLINTARGACVDVSALLDALDRGHITAAALDVVEREPLDDDRLRQHAKVLLTPHVAFYSVEAFNEMRTKGAEEARRILLGEKPRNVVNARYLKS